MITALQLDNISCSRCPVYCISAFKNFNAADLNALLQYKSIRNHKAGETLFSEGEKIRGIYCVYSGNIQISKISQGNKNLVLRIAKPGDNIGIHTISYEDTYSVTAVALTDANTCFILKKEFIAFLKLNNKYHIEVMKLQCAELENLEARSVKKKKSVSPSSLESIIYSLIKSYGINESGDIKEKISVEDLADIAESSVSEILNCLVVLIKKGLIYIVSDTINIQRPEYFKTLKDRKR